MEKFERYNPDQLRDIWDRVGAGESVKSIARSLPDGWGTVERPKSRNDPIAIERFLTAFGDVPGVGSRLDRGECRNGDL
jgi:hypothetical protein